MSLLAANRVWDVVILGGGFAGMSLALQLRQRSAEANILIVEKQKGPRPAAAYKVGESTVEAGAHYLSDTLGLQDYLEESHIRKLGLRCFFQNGDNSAIEKRLELGSNTFFPKTTYQIDRGLLENHLRLRCAESGVSYAEGAQVQQFTEGKEGAPHSVLVRLDGADTSVQAKWVVDTLGRRALLRSHFQLETDCSHQINAAWFRLKTKLNVGSWGGDKEWKERNTGEKSRYLSTNQLMGDGYWIWLIPLSSGSTSIGVVADPRFHPLTELNSFEKFLSWAKRLEPQLHAAITEVQDTRLDFQALKHFSRRVNRVFSQDRWAISGDSGFFIDPLYSPGIDFIGFSNTFITELISRDLMGKPFAGLAEIYNSLLLSFVDNTFQVYQNQYRVLGNPKVMPLKIIWDFATYWSFFALLSTHEQLGNVGLLSRFKDTLERVSEVNADMQSHFQRLHIDGDTAFTLKESSFIDLAEIPLLWNLNKLLMQKLEGVEFENRLEANIENLFELATLIRKGLSYQEIADFSFRETPGSPSKLSGEKSAAHQNASLRASYA